MSGTARATVTVEEAALLLGIGRSLAYQSVRAGQFPVPVIRVGTRYLIPRAPLETLHWSGSVSVAPNRAEEADIPTERFSSGA